MKKEDLKVRLRGILLGHEGQGNAITGRELAFMLEERDDRRVRLVIRELIKDGLPVASSVDPPSGYFVVATRREAERYAGSVRSRLINDALRRRDFRRAADQYLTPAKQGVLL